MCLGTHCGPFEPKKAINVLAILASVNANNLQFETSNLILIDFFNR